MASPDYTVYSVTPDGTYIKISDRSGPYTWDGTTMVLVNDVEVTATVEPPGPDADFTNKSGTITLGGTSQTLAAANAARQGWWVQNHSVGDLWVNDLGAAAIIGQPSIKIPAGALYEPPYGGHGGAALAIIGATTAQAFTAREW